MKFDYPAAVSIDVTPHDALAIRLSLRHKPSEIGINRAVFALLRGMGFDLRSQHFSGTPRRLTKLWMTYLADREITVKAFESTSDVMVTIKDHRVVSMCPHHMLPIVMVCDFAYVPAGWVVGLSKIPRIMDVMGGSFVLQEDFTDGVAKVIDTLLQPRGIAFRVRARHGCMRLRGVRTPGSVTTTALRGVMLTDEKARAEATFAMGEGDEFPPDDQ